MPFCHVHLMPLRSLSLSAPDNLLRDADGVKAEDPASVLTGSLRRKSTMRVPSWTTTIRRVGGMLYGWDGGQQSGGHRCCERHLPSSPRERASTCSRRARWASRRYCTSWKAYSIS